MAHQELDLSGLIGRIRTELEAAERDRRAAGRQALLELQSVDLELNFVVERTTSGEAGVSLKVFSVGADGTATRGARDERAHRIALHFSVSAAARAAELPGTRFQDDASGELPDIEPMR